ncbi:MAG: cytochrome P450 [Deltaproteobacteria bacterium]|nr:cytochrome P450 [Deltaproteobacteria bacterium]
MQQTSTDSTTMAHKTPPPGPRGKPIVGSMLDAWRDPLVLMYEGFKTHGPMVQFRFMHLRYVTIADADAAHYVLVENAKNYHKSRNYQGLKVLLGQGLLTSEGDFWRQQRKLAQPAFHRERLTALGDTMVRCGQDLLTRWEREMRGKTFDLHSEMMRLTFRIVGLTLLSVDLDNEAKTVGEALDVALHWANDYVESVVRLPLWVPTAKNRKFAEAKNTLTVMVQRIVTERREAIARGDAPGKDLLQMLLEAVDADTGATMSDAQLIDELLTLVLAGHETTANALSFALWLLAEHKDIRTQMCEEIHTVLGDRAPTMSDLPKLTYTTQVIEEVLRLYPPAWCFEREALSDDTIHGYHIPKGTLLGIAPYVLHRNPKYFADPLRFDPSRFAKGSASERPKHAYLPFGGGPRICIGNAFAMMEMQLLLAMIVPKFALERVPGHEVSLDAAVTLRPKGGLPMRSPAV